MQLKLEGRWVFRFEADAGGMVKPGRVVEARPGPPSIRLQSALRLRPRRALSSAEARSLPKPHEQFKAVNAQPAKSPRLIAPRQINSGKKSVSTNSLIEPPNRQRIQFSSP